MGHDDGSGDEIMQTSAVSSKDEQWADEPRHPSQGWDIAQNTEEPATNHDNPEEASPRTIATNDAQPEPPLADALARIAQQRPLRSQEHETESEDPNDCLILSPVDHRGQYRSDAESDSQEREVHQDGVET